jgi:peptide deformylase
MSKKLKIVQYPSEILRTKCQDIKEFDDSLVELEKNLFTTLESSQGFGLAAPQVGELLNIFVIKTNDKDYTFINPEILEEEGKALAYEACLSIQGIAERVYRPTRVKVKAFNSMGESFTLDTKNNKDLARCIMHEYDHINGILFIDRISDVKKEKVKKQLAKIKPKKEKLTKIKVKIKK